MNDTIGLSGPWLLTLVVTGVVGFLMVGDWICRVVRHFRWRLRLKRLREMRAMLGDTRPKMSSDKLIFLRSRTAHKRMNGDYEGTHI